MYDITQRETFIDLKNWMLELESHADIHSSIKMVVGNKLDHVSLIFIPDLFEFPSIFFDPVPIDVD